MSETKVFTSSNGSTFTVSLRRYTIPAPQDVVEIDVYDAETRELVCLDMTELQAAHLVRWLLDHAVDACLPEIKEILERRP